MTTHQHSRPEAAIGEGNSAVFDRFRHVGLRLEYNDCVWAMIAVRCRGVAVPWRGEASEDLTKVHLFPASASTGCVRGECMIVAWSAR